MKSFDELFGNEQQYAITAVAGWIAHPAVRRVVDRRRVQAETMTMLFEPFLVDQVQVLRFCCRVFDVAIRYPDGQEETNPFDRNDPQAWLLTPAERAVVDEHVSGFRAVVEFAMLDLTAAGVPLDPEWDGDRVAVGELLLLSRAGHSIPWDDPAPELAAKLQVPGVSAIHRDGRGGVARDGRGERAAINADRIRTRVRAQAGGRNLSMPYAGGAQRRTPVDKQIRQDVLREVLERFPQATVAMIRRDFDNSERTAGGTFRQLWTTRLGRQPSKPSRDTLHKDFLAIRTAPPNAEHES